MKPDPVAVLADMINGIDDECRRAADGLDPENLPAMESFERIKARFCIGVKCLEEHRNG
jgi:hypothetical protein